MINSITSITNTSKSDGLTEKELFSDFMSLGFYKYVKHIKYFKLIDVENILKNPGANSLIELDIKVREAGECPSIHLALVQEELEDALRDIRLVRAGWEQLKAFRRVTEAELPPAHVAWEKANGRFAGTPRYRPAVGPAIAREVV